MTKQDKKPGERLSSGKRSQMRQHLNERLTALHHRAMLIEQELVELDANRFYRACIFGSARIKPDTRAYNEVFTLARMLAWHGIDVLTGGGPGLMEAANHGAKLGQEEKQSKSISIGLSIQLDTEARANSHLDVNHHHFRFSSRLDEFMRLSHAIVATPGGVGTLLELVFSWQLVQRHHLSPRPIILLGREFWTGFIDWMKAMPTKLDYMEVEDFDFIHIVDSPEDAFEIISAHQKQLRESLASPVK